jgi:hypothetical protein
VKTDNGTGRPAFSFRERLEAEFLLQFASKLRPDEVIEAHYVDTGATTGYKVGFADMYYVEFVVDAKLSDERIDNLLGTLRTQRHKMAQFAIDLAASQRASGHVIAMDYIGGCIAALIFETAKQGAHAMSAGTVTFKTPEGTPHLDTPLADVDVERFCELAGALRVTLLERLRDDLLEHKSGADSGGHGPCHKTPAAVFAELDAAIAAESSWARFVDLQASTASVAPPPRFVEVKEARPPAATKARRVLVAIDTIDAISYEPWQVVLVVRAYTADGHPTHVTYYRNFDTEDTPDAAAAAFIALCTRTP